MEKINPENAKFNRGQVKYLLKQCAFKLGIGLLKVERIQLNDFVYLVSKDTIIIVSFSLNIKFDHAKFFLNFDEIWDKYHLGGK